MLGSPCQKSFTGTTQWKVHVQVGACSPKKFMHCYYQVANNVTFSYLPLVAASYWIYHCILDFHAQTSIVKPPLMFEKQTQLYAYIKSRVLKKVSLLFFTGPQSIFVINFEERKLLKLIQLLGLCQELQSSLRDFHLPIS
jgi:hypothetical protein